MHVVTCHVAELSNLSIVDECLLFILECGSDGAARAVMLVMRSAKRQGTILTHEAGSLLGGASSDPAIALGPVLCPQHGFVCTRRRWKILGIKKETCKYYCSATLSCVRELRNYASLYRNSPSRCIIWLCSAAAAVRWCQAATPSVMPVQHSGESLRATLGHEPVHPGPFGTGVVCALAVP